MPTCQSCNMVWSVPPGSSSSPVHRRTSTGWCAAGPAERWGWSAQTGCWFGPTAWPADLCLPSAAGSPLEDKPDLFFIIITGFVDVVVSKVCSAHLYVSTQKVECTSHSYLVLRNLCIGFVQDDLHDAQHLFCYGGSTTVFTFLLCH